jgi:hypothetical protein
LGEPFSIYRFQSPPALGDLAIILFVKALIGSLSNKISQNKQLILIQLVRE